MNRQTLPFELHIPEPCTQPWAGMTGDHAQRYCESCNKQVHNLAALTQSQIEVLLLESDGNLCARISRSPDGALVLQPTSRQLKSPTAAGFILAASLTAASTANAQAPIGSQAIVSGNILTPEGYVPEGKYGVKLSQNDGTSITILTDDKGGWQTEIRPGIYDLQIFPFMSQGSLAIPAVTFHAGQQSFANIRTINPTFNDVFVGDIVTRVTWTTMLARHPILSLKYFYRRYL